MKSIELPSSLIAIGRTAFYDCTNLESIRLPESIESVGTYAFTNCPNLTITVPNREIKLLVLKSEFTGKIIVDGEEYVEPLYFKDRTGKKFYQVIATGNPYEPLDVIEVKNIDAALVVLAVKSYVIKDLTTNEYFSLMVNDDGENITFDIVGPGTPNEGDNVVDYIDFSSNEDIYRLEYNNHNIILTRGE